MFLGKHSQETLLRHQGFVPNTILRQILHHLWGGFFAGEKYNFFIFGQENPSQNNDTEVIRVVKYSKDWKRLGQTSLRGASISTILRG